jgi:Kef-type K+ transport system membrane component KefB
MDKLETFNPKTIGKLTKLSRGVLVLLGTGAVIGFIYLMLLIGWDVSPNLAADNNPLAFFLGFIVFIITIACVGPFVYMLVAPVYKALKWFWTGKIR